MPNESLLYDLSSFLCSLFLLERGSDIFIDKTVLVASLTGTPQTLIALLTAGAEWEELAVIAISLAKHRDSLALGNIVGSSISNILGAFSLGLLFSRKGDGEGEVGFDQSGRIYGLVLLVWTVCVCVLLGFGDVVVRRVMGWVLIVGFVGYVVSIGVLISRGRIRAPELSDSDSDSDTESDDQSSIEEDDHGRNTSTRTPVSADSQQDMNETSTLLPRSEQPQSSPQRQSKHSLLYHILYLILGLVLILVASYVLSHSSSAIAKETALSDHVFGTIFLSLATTLPEKFIAVMSGYKGHSAILVANTAGSNVFLLSLCLGVFLVSTNGEMGEVGVHWIELVVLILSTLGMVAVVFGGGRGSKVIGALMLVGYFVLLTLEFTVVWRA